MKPAGGRGSSVQQLQEIEIPSSENGISEDLIEVPKQQGTEWAWSLWENRRFLWLCIVRGLIVSTIIAFVLPIRYESTTRLMPPEKESTSPLTSLAAMAAAGGGGGATGAGGGGGSAALADMASGLLGGKSEGALFVEVLHSRTIADRIIDRFDLRKVYWIRYYEDARKKLAKNTQISEDRKSGIITITVRDRDPNRATRMTQAYVDELDRLIAQVSTSAARRERIFLEQRLRTAKQDLDKASRDFSEYASNNTAIDIPEQGKAMVQAAAVLQGELIAAQSELEGLEQIYTPNNVRIRSLQARVAELNRQLDKLGGDETTLNSNTVGGRGNMAGGAEDPASTDLYPSIRKLPLLGVRWADLYRETKIQEIVYQLLTEQYELAKIEEAKEIPSVKVLDAANAPEKRATPKRKLVVAIGTLLAFIAGAFWVLAVGLWREMDKQDPRKLILEDIAGKSTEFFSRCAVKGRELLRLRSREKPTGPVGESK